MKKLINTLSATALALALAGCPDDGKPKTNGGDDDKDRSVWGANKEVYVVGEEARLWKNGAQQLLSNHSTADARSVFVADGNVYAAGVDMPGGSSHAVVWSKGSMTRLSNGTDDADAESIFVADGKVYVAGSVRNSLWESTATLWVDGAAQPLASGSQGTYASSVYVSGDDVYVAGGASFGERAILWKNGVAQTLSSGGWAYARTVHVSGGKTYVTGYDAARGGAVLWVDGVVQDVGSFWPVSVFVSGGDVYLGGYAPGGAEGFAAVWKNGTVTNYSDGKGEANVTAFYVSGSDVYLVGYELDRYDCAVPTVWINGRSTQRLAGENSDIIPWGVYVVDKGR